MTALLWTFVLALVSVSGGLYAAARLFQRVDARADQWSALWATGLGLSVVIPALGLALLSLPDWAPSPAFEALSLHEPLQSLGIMTAGPEIAPFDAGLFTLANALTVILALYGAGVFVTGLRLALGRLRLRLIIASADPIDRLGHADVVVSSRVGTPFAWTPIGRPHRARIVIPVIYAQHMRDESLADILTHERAHIARRDDEVGLILRSLLCAAWVSPFAHWMFARWSQSTEIRCDMAVTAGRDPQMRTAYANTLLRALHIVAGRVRQYPAASFSTHRIRNEKMRIAHIMQGSQPTYKRPRDKVLLALVASAVTVVGMISISTTASAGDPAPQAKAAPQAAEAPKAEKIAPKVPKAPKADKNRVFSAMVTGHLTSSFGPAPDPFNKGQTRDHYGIDIAAPTGTPIYAPANGVIMAATDVYNGNPAYGNVVVLQTSGGVLTMFAHLDGFTVTPGQSVSQGTQIATVGNSGKSTEPHVHIETHKNSARVDPLSVWTIGGQ
ncbi:MAG: M23/M56 family metallopeptidase [Litorimonas sp.]